MVCVCGGIFRGRVKKNITVEGGGGHYMKNKIIRGVSTQPDQQTRP